MNKSKVKIDNIIAFVFIVLVFVSVFILVVGGYYFYIHSDKQNNFSRTRILSKKIELISKSEVLEYKGNVKYSKNGNYTELRKNILIEEDTGFKTSEDSSVSIKMHRDNQVKLYSSSECLVKYPEYDSSNEKIEKQVVKLINGEITAAVTIEGKGILRIEVSNLTIFAQSGLFKVLYNGNEDKGEVVVKNGLIEVKENGSGSRPIKLSGFYKATFEKGKLNNPVQASIIRYEWR